jgi:hypothetical protein
VIGASARFRVGFARFRAEALIMGSGRLRWRRAPSGQARPARAAARRGRRGSPVKGRAAIAPATPKAPLTGEGRPRTMRGATGGPRGCRVLDVIFGHQDLSNSRAPRARTIPARPPRPGGAGRAGATRRPAMRRRPAQWTCPPPMTGTLRRARDRRLEERPTCVGAVPHAMRSAANWEPEEREAGLSVPSGVRCRGPAARSGDPAGDRRLLPAHPPVSLSRPPE